MKRKRNKKSAGVGRASRHGAAVSCKPGVLKRETISQADLQKSCDRQEGRGAIVKREEVGETKKKKFFPQERKDDMPALSLLK